ncbi:MAG: CRISPR-associated endonuclease Cas2 [Bacteroidetes bacterium]|nr:CRISPR-associated endonuclease Cas2 [Bacteroidota bacterium]
MRQARTFYILMYDITHDRTLQKVARNLEQCGYLRLNYSVWFGWFDPNKNPEFRNKLKELLKNPLAKGSRFYVLPIAAKDFEKIRHHDGRKLKDLDYWTGDRATEFF